MGRKPNCLCKTTLSLISLLWRQDLLKDRHFPKTAPVSGKGSQEITLGLRIPTDGLLNLIICILYYELDLEENRGEKKKLRERGIQNDFWQLYRVV